MKRRLLAALLAAVVALVAIEVGVRALLGAPAYHAQMVYDAELGFRMEPGLDLGNHDPRGAFRFRLNAAGSRGPELPDAPPPAGVERVLFVGDSYVNAFAVREDELVFVTLRRVARERGREVETYALSCDGYGTAQELLLLRRHVEAVAPTRVVLALYPGNDVSNNGFELAGRTDARGEDYLRPYLAAKGGGYAWRHVHPVLAFLRSASWSFGHLERQVLARAGREGWAWTEPWTGGVERSVERLKRGELPGERFELFREHEGDAWSSAWAATEELLRRFRDEVRAAGAEPLVVVIPTRQQVQWDGLLRAIDFNVRRFQDRSLEDELDWNLPERRLASFLAREDVPALFLLERLRQRLRTDPEPLYGHDNHLTGRAHLAAAEWIADALWEEPRAGEEAFTRPVDVLEALAPEPRFDLRRGGLELLGYGWTAWTPGEHGVGPGWTMGASAQVVPPTRDRDIALRGLVPPWQPLPATFTVLVDGRRALRRTVEAHGALELRVPAEELGEGPVPPVVVLRVDSARAPATGGEPIGFVIQELGVGDD